MLKEVAARQPAVILDVAAILSRRQQETPADPPAEPPADPPAEPEIWCVCNHCPPMDRDEDKFCCRMAPQHCNSLRPVS